MRHSSRQILVVDDRPEARGAFLDNLRGEGGADYRILAPNTLEQCLREIKAAVRLVIVGGPLHRNGFQPGGQGMKNFEVVERFLAEVPHARFLDVAEEPDSISPDRFNGNGRKVRKFSDVDELVNTPGRVEYRLRTLVQEALHLAELDFIEARRARG